MASTVAPISDVRPGYVVVTGHEAIGEVEDILEAGHVTYLSVRCNALGLDELFIPSHAIERVVETTCTWCSTGSTCSRSPGTFDRPGRSRGRTGKPQDLGQARSGQRPGSR